MNDAKRYKPTAGDIAAGFLKKVPDTACPSAPGYRSNSRSSEKHSNSKDGKSSVMREKRTCELPQCLNPKCPNRHFFKDCEDNSVEDKEKFKAEYMDKKRSKKANVEHKKHEIGSAKTIGLVKCVNSHDKTSLFSASFCYGTVEATVLADQGADANRIPPSVLDAIVKADPNVHIQNLRSPIVFSNARSSVPPIQCNRQVEVDVLLRVRHGTNLMLRGVKWLITKDEVQYVFMARHVLAALGINKRVLLAAAADRYNSVVDVPDVLRKDGQNDKPCAHQTASSSIHGILYQREIDFGSTFHSQGSNEDDFLEDKNIYVDLGDDPQENSTRNDR